LVTSKRRCSLKMLGSRRQVGFPGVIVTLHTSKRVISHNIKLMAVFMAAVF